MPTFKDYTMNQLQLPLSFEDFIPENHLVRVVNTVVDSLELKPLYDRYGTENRYIVGFTIHPNPTDTKTMIPHLNHLEESLGRLPENIVADAGYGSEENYEYLEEKNLGSYVKYNRFHWEKKKKNRENPYLSDNLPYTPETDSVICRNGRPYLSDDSLLKMLYLATMDITKKWTGHRQDWGQIHSQLEIYFEERLENRLL